MTKTFTRTQIRAAIAQADAETPKTLAAPQKAQRAVEILTGADFIDAERAVDMAGSGLGAIACDKLVSLAIARLSK